MSKSAISLRNKRMGVINFTPLTYFIYTFVKIKRG